MKREITVPVPYGNGECKTIIVETRSEQKFEPGTEVYIKPMTDSSKLHFDGDVIATAEYTYSQAYGGRDVKSYSTNIASWYDEGELMPTNGLSLDECRAACQDYFGVSHSEMLKERQDNIDNCPLRKYFEMAFKDTRSKFVKSFVNL